MQNNKFNFKEEWYFIRQDIVSYSISTFLYIILCLIKQMNLQSFLYSLFECLTFCVSFWFIRVKFDLTYHSDSWKTCKFWTRTMLCLGVFTLWILPIKYTLFNGLFVAFVCCLVLYLVAKHNKKDIYTMSENDLRQYGASKQLSEIQQDILCMRVLQHLRISEICEYYNYGRSTIKYHITEIKKKLNIDKI